MSDNTLEAIQFIVTFGWIPILAVGVAVAWVVEAYRTSKEHEDERN